MTKTEQATAREIRHIGYLSLCDAEHRITNIHRIDLGRERYEQLGVKERFKDEAPYRVCKRCIAKLFDANATKGKR